ncbi:hypothetical protein F0P96_11205 [Hymenobacter busanensis]|uniref:Uncharacterized protein n=1 Tax=Hymenobacter busanensis TaxID=2607656 RepID=A0A7L5A1L7_9BACT|nr:hypothetical protein [Hymenobacter busanensis]KAA9332052.1 hypothetical protein F0P96_11205 [Hymenobacter busanensis]QHJ07610.1 hypothetical protein GUY19_10070 [Hymenobacter busanensis]
MLRLVSFCALLIATGLVAACSCDGAECSPCNPYEDDVVLRFDLDSLHGGFRRSDLQTAYMVRYARNDFARPLDTLHYNRPNDGRPDYRRLDGFSALAFAVRPDGEPRAFSSYSYRVVLPRPARTYDVTDIELAGETGKGCCACYQNTRKRFRLNGTYTTADADQGRGVVLRP